MQHIFKINRALSHFLLHESHFQSTFHFFYFTNVLKNCSIILLSSLKSLVYDCFCKRNFTVYTSVFLICALGDVCCFYFPHLMFYSFPYLIIRYYFFDFYLVYVLMKDLITGLVINKSGNHTSCVFFRP